MLHLSGVNYESINDAPGMNCVIFVSGCKHDCPGCHSPKTHDFTYGTKATKDVIGTINAEISKRPFLSGLVLSGGDPMYSAKEVSNLLDELVIPKERVWCFTGFRIEQLLGNEEQRELLQKIDVLVDGPFLSGERDVTLAYRGSRNQRLIDVKATLQTNEVVLYQI